MSDEYRYIQIEKCGTQKTKFFFNGIAYRIAQPDLMKLFNLTRMDMNKLCNGLVVTRKYTKSVLDEKFAELERLKRLTLT